MIDVVPGTAGEGLSPENVRYQLVTFLIAGHEASRFHPAISFPRFVLTRVSLTRR